MKVLRIIARLNVGGPSRHVVWLTEDLNDDEFQSLLIAGRVPDGEESMEYLAEDRGVRPVFIEEMSRELSPKDVVSLLKLYRELKRFGPDIIHTHTAKAGTLGRTASLLYRLLSLGRRRVKVVHTFHGHVFHSYYGAFKTRIFVTIERVLARFATDRIVTISQQQFGEIHRDFGVGREGQFAIIPLGIDVEAFDDPGERRERFRNEIGAKADEIVVGFVGRLTEIKDISLYLRVAASVAKDPSASKVRFFIAGDGHLRSALEKEADQLALGDRMMFIGNRSDTEAVYAGSDIIALTSLNEGTPLSLIEAMAAGRPVISTVVGGVRDLLGETVEQGDGFRICERGIGIENRSPDEYTKGLIYLAKNERLRERLADEGRQFAVANYSKARLIGDIKTLYRELAADN